MFSCEDVLAELSGYLDDEIIEPLKKQIEAHMVHCRSCRAVYDSTRKTLRIVTDSASFELSEDVSSRLAGRIRSRIEAKAPGSGGPSGT